MAITVAALAATAGAILATAAPAGARTPMQVDDCTFAKNQYTLMKHFESANMAKYDRWLRDWKKKRDVPNLKPQEKKKAQTKIDYIHSLQYGSRYKVSWAHTEMVKACR